MLPGDIIFFRAQSLLQRANTTLQTIAMASKLRLGFRKWSHVAVCVRGPLICHAMPHGGVHLTVLPNSPLTKFRIFRHVEPIDVEALQNACVFWLGEEYSLRALLRLRDRARLSAVQSFCSLLVQKIFSDLKIAPFTTYRRPLVPLELYNLLRHANGWVCMMAPLTSDERVTHSPGDTSRMDQSERLLCESLLHHLEMRVSSATITKSLSEAVSTHNAAIENVLLSPTLPEEFKKRILETIKPPGYQPPESSLLDYRTMLRPGPDVTLLSEVQRSLAVNWSTANHDITQLGHFPRSGIESGNGSNC